MVQLSCTHIFQRNAHENVPAGQGMAWTAPATSVYVPGGAFEHNEDIGPR
jgi:hypothetical protein